MTLDDLERKCQNIMNTVHNMELWKAGHEAEMKAFIRNQIDLNKAFKDSIEETKKRTDALEKRVMWICGIVTTVGSVFGNFFGQLLSN